MHDPLIIESNDHTLQWTTSDQPPGHPSHISPSSARETPETQLSRSHRGLPPASGSTPGTRGGSHQRSPLAPGLTHIGQIMGVEAVKTIHVLSFQIGPLSRVFRGNGKLYCCFYMTIKPYPQNTRN